MPEQGWQDHVKGLLNAELKRRNISYPGLAEKLTSLGAHEKEVNIKNKISRGGFTTRRDPAIPARPVPRAAHSPSS